MFEEVPAGLTPDLDVEGAGKVEEGDHQSNVCACEGGLSVYKPPPGREHGDTKMCTRAGAKIAIATAKECGLEVRVRTHEDTKGACVGGLAPGEYMVSVYSSQKEDITRYRARRNIAAKESGIHPMWLYHGRLDRGAFMLTTLPIRLPFVILGYAASDIINAIRDPLE
jgi:hypothetical protein